MNPPLVKNLGLAMRDKSSAVRLACRITLGLELHHLKQELGYSGAGTYWMVRDDFKPGERLRWPDYCRAVAGISERSAENYYHCGEAVKLRVRTLARPGSKELHRKMEKQPSTLSAAERADMIQKIIILGLSKGETQEQLRREYRGVFLPEPETHRENIGESGNDGERISMGELQRRYPEESDRNLYTLSKACGDSEEKARLLVVVMREHNRRQAKLGF